MTLKDADLSTRMSDLLQPSLKPIGVEELNQLFKEITDAYDRAQTWTKKYETTFNEVPIACINQMRNAGYHMCRFINDSKLTQSQPLINIDELRSIYKHLLRAYYDVLDEFTKRINELLSEIERNYRDLLLNPIDYFSDFYKWKDTLTELEEFNISDDDTTVNEISLKKPKREQHYERISSHIGQLTFINSQIRHMSDRLIIEAQKINNANKRYWFQEGRNWIGFFVGIIITAITLLFGNSLLSKNKDVNSKIAINSH